MQTRRPSVETPETPARQPVPARLTRAALLWGALLLAGLAVLIWQVFQASQEASDFCQDYVAAQRLLHGEPVYAVISAWLGKGQCQAYDAHPPASVLFFSPFGVLPYMQAAMLWGLLSLAAYLVSGALLLQALGWPKLRGMALFAAASVCWAPLTGAEHAQNLGQVLLLLVIAAWLAERKGRPGLAGTLLGAAGLLKLWPLLLLAGALVWRKGRLLLASAATVAVGTALSLAFLGISAYTAYFGPVQVNEHLSVPDVSNVSLVGVLLRFALVPAQAPFLRRPSIPEPTLSHALFLAELASGVVFLAVLALLWWCRRRAASAAVELMGQSLLVTLAVLIFPITWQWGLITLLFPGALLVLALRQLPGAPRVWRVLLWVSILPLLAPGRTIVAGLSKLLTSIHLASFGDLLTQVFVNWLLVLAPFGLALLMLAQIGLLWYAARQAAPEAQTQPA